MFLSPKDGHRESRKMLRKAGSAKRKCAGHAGNDFGGCQNKRERERKEERLEEMIDQNKGEWKYNQWFEGMTEIWCYVCSCCGYRTVNHECYELPRFCPSCGTQMENSTMEDD